MATRKTIFKGHLVDLGLEQAQLPSGHTVDLEIIRHPGAAGVVPLHSDGTVTLIHQHRHAAGGMIYEIPAGLLEPGEPPQVSAARELAEEVQLQAEQYTHLATIHTTPGFTDEQIHLFAARGLSAAAGEPEAEEFIRVVRLPLREALAMVRDGRITDAKTICALLLAAGA